MYLKIILGKNIWIWTTAKLMKKALLCQFCFLSFKGLELTFFSGVYGTCIGAVNRFGTEEKSLIGLSGIFIGVGEILGESKGNICWWATWIHREARVFAFSKARQNIIPCHFTVLWGGNRSSGTIPCEKTVSSSAFTWEMCLHVLGTSGNPELLSLGELVWQSWQTLWGCFHVCQFFSC